MNHDSECKMCMKAFRVSMFSISAFMLALGAIGLWAFTETMQLHQEINIVRVEQRQELALIDKKFTTALGMCSERSIWR